MSQRNERSMLPELDGVTHWLIHHAAARAPACLSSRLEEEWLADLESRFSGLSRLRFAAGCCWAALVIVNDHPRSRVPAASAVLTAKVWVADVNCTLADRNFGYFSLRSGTLFLIVGLYAALFCGLTTTLTHTRGLATPPSSDNHVLNPLPPEIEMTYLFKTAR
jgi:hypothetical protein